MLLLDGWVDLTTAARGPGRAAARVMLAVEVSLAVLCLRAAARGLGLRRPSPEGRHQP